MDSTDSKVEEYYAVHFARHVLTNDVVCALIPADKSLQELFGDVQTYEEFYVEVDGEHVVLTADNPYFPNPSQVVDILHVPQDKDMFKVILSIVVQIAIIVFAPELSGWQYAAYVAVASTAAQLAINSLIPYEPLSTQSRGTGELSSGIAPSRNRVAVYEPVSQVFGRIRQWPAYAALPYTELIGDDSYLNALFIVGYGEFSEPTSLRIGNTLLDGFDGVEIRYLKARDGVEFPQIVEDNYNLPLNQPIDTPGDSIVRRTALNTKYISVDIVFPRGLIHYGKDATRYTLYVDFKIEVQKVGEATWTLISSEDNATNHWKDLTWGDNTVEWVEHTSGIGSAVRKKRVYYTPTTHGDVVPAFITAGTTGLFRIAGKTIDTMRRGIKFKPPGGVGQYDVRVTRVHTMRKGDYASPSLKSETFVDWDNYYVADALFTALRSFKDAIDVVPINRAPGDADITYCVLRVKASDQLSGQLDQFSHVLNRVYSYWNGTEWVYDTHDSATQVYPRSPAWSAVEVLTDKMNPRPVPLAKIDGAGFKVWADWCKTNGFFYDDELTGERSVWETLQRIASVGRAEIVVRNGLYTVMMDNAVSTAVQVFTPRNSWGFRGSKTFIEPIHAVKVSYRAETEDYEEAEQIVYNDGYTSANATKFEALSLPGVTDASQAWRQGRRFMGIAIHRPEFYELNVDLEHILCLRGDTVLIQHEAALIGQIALRIQGIDGARVTLSLDGDIVYEVGKTYQVQVRYKSGTSLLIHTGTVSSFPSASSVLLTVALPASVAVGDLVVFGEQNLTTLRAKVLAIKPKADHTAAITFVPEGDGIYVADTGTIPPYNPVISQPSDFSRVVPQAPIVLAVTSGKWGSPVQPTGDQLLRIVVTYLVQNLASFAGVEVQGRIRELSDDVNISVLADWRTTDWQRSDGGTIYFDHIQEEVEYEIQLRVRTLPNNIVSSWSSITTHVVEGVSANPPMLSGATVTGRAGGVDVEVDLSLVDVRNAQYLEVLYGTTNNYTVADNHAYFSLPANTAGVASIKRAIELSDGTIRYFWFRIVNKAGNAGLWYPDVLTTPSTGLSGFATQTDIYYILPLSGTVIVNSGNTLSIQARKSTGAGDVLLSSGDVKMYMPDGTTLAGDGYAWTGITAADISSSLVITLKNASTGVVYDTIALADITDGAAGGSGEDAIFGFFSRYSKLLWRREKDGGAWLPNTDPIVVDVTFMEGSTDINRDALSLALNTTTGAITVSAATHTDGDLSAGSVTWLINGATRTLPYNAGSVATLTAQIDISGNVYSVTETIYSIEGGSQGSAAPNSAIVMLFKRTTTGDTPAVPSVDTSYNFSTGVPTGMDNGWTANLPTSGGEYRWMIKAVVVDATTTGTIVSAGWSTPVIIAQDGAPGISGASSVASLGLKLNSRTFAGGTSPAGCMYLHGFTDGVAADVVGKMNYNGAIISVAQGTLVSFTDVSRDAYVLFDTVGSGVFTANGSAASGGTTNYSIALVQRLRNGEYKYDTASGWTTFTLTGSMVIIGSYTRVSGSIASAVLLGNGMSPSVMSMVDAEIVKPGDIAPNAINNVAAFASSLRPVELVSSLTTTGTWGGSEFVFNTANRKVYRLVSNTPPVWTAQVDGSDIVANSITAGQIGTGAITAEELAANSVIASKLAVSSTMGRALNEDPFFEDPVIGATGDSSHAWTHTGGQEGGSVVDLLGLGMPMPPSGTKVLQATSQGYVFTSKKIPVDYSKTYRISVWAREQVASTRILYTTVAFLKEDGSEIVANSPVDTACTGWPGKGDYHYSTTHIPTSTWTQHSLTFGAKGQAKFPTNNPGSGFYPAKFMRIGVLISYGTGATQCQIHDLRVEEVVPGVMIEDGAVTADKIAANAVTADKILANQVTTAKLAAGAVTVDKMQVGGANLINDPGFEFSYAPWVSGWSSFSTHSVPTIASGGYSGLKYAVLPGTPAGGGTWIKSAPFLVAAEEKLYVSCRAARVGTPSVGYNAYITMYIYQPDGSTYITQAVHLIGSAIGTSAWELHGFEVTVPAAAGIGIVSFELQGGDGCYIAVDDFRCVKMTDASLIVSGAITTDKLDAGAVTAAKIGANQVTAGKLEANMVISNVVSTAPDTAVPGANPRVVLDASTIPLWIGSGAKTLANAKLQFDTTTGELLIRGVLNASVLDFDDFVTLGVRGSAGKLSMAMAVARSTQFGALTNLTDYVELSATHQYYSPGYGVESGAYARIQVADQPLEFDYCGEITNLNFTDVTYAVYLRYRYDEGTPSVPSWSAYSYYQLPTTTVNKVAPARAATIVPSSRNFAGGAHLKFKASGWQRVDLTLVIKQISGVTHASNLQAVGSVKLMLINLGVGDFTEGYYLLT